MSSTSDDEDWLYRRGNYSGGDEPGASASEPVPTPPRVAPQPAPPRVAPQQAAASVQPPRAAEPTPVGHYDAGGVPLRDQPPAPPRPPVPPTAEPAPEPEPRVRRPRRPHRVRRAVLAIAVLLLVYLLGVPLATWPFGPKVNADPGGPRPADSPGYVYVLAGSDSREGLSTQEQNKLGTGNDAGKRTDTIMLLYVPPSGRAALISVPRDSYVAIPGHGKNKINAAYSFGGAPLLVQTIEQNTGLHVDGYVEVGFGGFVNVVDAVGGIEMCPPAAIKDRDSNLDIPAGCQQMNGTTALGYVRMRKADPEGDLGRAKRQREMVSALAKKVLSPATVLLPWRWWGVNSSASKSLTLGDGTPMFGLTTAAIKVGTGESDTLSVPVGNPNANTPAGSSVLWDATKSKAFFEAMKRGEGDLKQYA